MIGTPRYMAPEQWDGHSDAPADMRALGATLYTAVGGTSGVDSLIELDASTGRWIRTITLPGDSASGSGISVEASYMVVEINADSGGVVLQQHLGDGNAIVDDGADVWVTSLGLANPNGSIIELNADNGHAVRTIVNRPTCRSSCCRQPRRPARCLARHRETARQRERPAIRRRPRPGQGQRPRGPRPMAPLPHPTQGRPGHLTSDRKKEGRHVTNRDCSTGQRC
jgi:serine/threonine protein kinase